MTIGGMDRRIVFSNPTVVKTDSGGHLNTWETFWECWCRLNQNSGFKSDAGSQDNLVANVDVEVRYNSTLAEYLYKDTKFTIGSMTYQVTDYQIDSRSPMVQIKAVGKKSGSTTLNTSTVQAYLYTGTGSEGNVFTLAALRNKTIITVETGRAIPIGIIYSGTPNEVEIKYTSGTGAFEVTETAPILEGEKFRIIYKG